MRTLFLALLVSALSGQAAWGEDPAPPKTKLDEKALAEGRRLFEQSATWVTQGRKDLGQIRDVFVDIMDMKMEVDSGSRHEGNLRLWYQAPDKLRWALRQEASDPSNIKVLDGEQMWISTPVRNPAQRTWSSHRKYGPEGMAMLAQLKKDRDRFVRLTRFLSLSSLDGKGVTFEYEGEKSWPEGHHLAGTWLKVKRHAPDGERMALLFARGPGPGLAAAQPFAVLQPGQDGEPYEHLVLGRWRRTPYEAWPRRIERFGKGPKAFRRTMVGFVVRLRVNRGLPAARFQPTGGDAPEKE